MRLRLQRQHLRNPPVEHRDTDGVVAVVDGFIQQSFPLGAEDDSELCLEESFGSSIETESQRSAIENGVETVIF